MTVTDRYAPEMVDPRTLKAHPQNYREHPPDQIAHIKQSIVEHGVYRNIVVSLDDYVLAGHGVWSGTLELDMPLVPIRRMPYQHDAPAALKLLAADNTISHLAIDNDRALADLLKMIKETSDAGLDGTGYDDAMLANLVFVTRPETEIQNFDAAAQWAGMPAYDESAPAIELRVFFRTSADRETFGQRNDLHLTSESKSAWWPYKPEDDVSSIRFVAGAPADDE